MNWYINLIQHQFLTYYQIYCLYLQIFLQYLQGISERMLNLAKRIFMNQSNKKKMSQRLVQFLTVDAGATIRNTPTTKQRKYKNVQITEDFKRMDDKRKKQRYQNMRKRQVLLQYKLKNEQKLLSGPQSQSIKTQLATIEQSIKNSQKQIQQLTEIIDSTEADFMVVQGHLKISVMNQIKYLKYIHDNNPGFTLHPETIKAIQNVHYCVNHNLPIKRLTLYEIMPDLFQAEVQQLQESVIQLIEQKQIDFANEDATSSIRFFYRVDRPLLRNRSDELRQIQLQRQRVVMNLYDHCTDLIAPHQALLEKVAQGKTPFRGIQHMITVMMSDMPIKYLPEEEQFRSVVLKMVQYEKQWTNYSNMIDKKLDQLKHKYIQPPKYIRNHPLLAAAYEELMKTYTTAQPLEQYQKLPQGDMTQVKLGQKMQQQMRAIVRQKYDPLFIEAMNNDRSKIDNKKLEIEFLNLSTNILQELSLLADNSNPQQELFKKLPKKPSLLTAQRKKNLIRVDDLTRMLYLNNKDKNKYNLQFFSKWFGVDIEQLKTLLKYVSYMRVPFQTEKSIQAELKSEILRFQL